MIHEIRETIQQTGDSDPSSGILQFQKRIQLNEGMRHTINHIDFFDDGLFAFANNQDEFIGYQVLVTNYPIVITDNLTPVGNQEMSSAPLAGDDMVLFKANMLSSAVTSSEARWEFPNQFLGSMPTFTFYTPQLYFTVIIERTSGTPEFSRSISMSLYMAVDSVEAPSVEYGIGMLQEYSENQAMLLRSQGIVITQAEIRAAIPMWQIGGIRPEFMASTATNTLGENWFFSTAGYGNSEKMSLTADVRIGLQNARKMVSHGDAFGTGSTTKAIPDWFKAIAKPFPGLEGGAIRQQEPPLKHHDNGNVMMLE